MNRIRVIFIIFLATVQGALAQQVDKDALRKLVRLPQMNIEGGLPFIGYNDFFRRPKSVDPKEIEALKKALRGDASDAPRHLKLAELFARQNRRDEAAAAFAKAESLFKPLVEKNPKDGTVRLQYARCLEAVEKINEAEKMHRETVRLFPKNSEAWHQLADFLTQKGMHEALTIFREEAKSKPPEGKTDVLALLASRQIPAEHKRMFDQCMDEAALCFDKVVSLSPKQPDAYRNRAEFRSFYRGMIPAAMRAAHGEKVNALEQSLSSETLADLHEVARLDPNNAEAVGRVAMGELGVLAAQGRAKKLGTMDAWKQLDKETQTRMEALIERLQGLTKHSNKINAAIAAQSLGMLLMMLKGDLDKAIQMLWLAVTNEPDRENAWDSLMLLTVGNRSDKEIVAVCEARLKHHDTWRNRLLYAKALERSERFEEMNEQIDRALKLAPDEAMPNLFKAAALLRNARDVKMMEEVHRFLSRTDDAVVKSPNTDHAKEMTFVIAIFNGLLGHVDAAVQSLRDILEVTGEDPRVRDALKVLGE